MKKTPNERGWMPKSRFHYGVWVNPKIPTTGVFSNNSVEFLWDCICSNNYINLDQEYILEDIFPREPEESELELDCSVEYLIGFKKTKSKEKAVYWYDKRKMGYAIDKDAEFSAIIRESESQVIKSKWFIRGALCSPCYPGQVDANTPGTFLAYSFPPDLLGANAKLYNIFKKGREKK